MQSNKQAVAMDLFDLENEIQETVQQLKDDLEENQTLYDSDHVDPETGDFPSPRQFGAESLNMAVDDAMHAMNGNNTSNHPMSASSSNHTNFFTPHSVSQHVDRSDKRAMLKAFLMSKSGDNQQTKTPIISAHSKPEQFQELLNGLNEQMKQQSAVNPVDVDPTLSLDEDEIISDTNPETQQELSELYREIEKTQKEFQDQLLSVDKGLMAERLRFGIGDDLRMDDGAEEKDRAVHFDDDQDLKQKYSTARPALTSSLSVQLSPKRNNIESPLVARSVTMGSPKASRPLYSPRSATATSRSSTYKFGTGRELEWEKGLKRRLEDQDPLAVCLDRIGSPRKMYQLKMMVDRAQHPSECTFQPQLINGGKLPSMYPQLSNLNQPFLHRQQQWVHNANKKLQYEQTKLRLKQESQCTFTPQINERDDDDTFSTMSQRQEQSLRGGNHQESLRKRRLMLQIQEKQEEEFRRHCTFKPKLCKSSTKIVHDMKQNRKFKERYKSMTALKIHDDDDEMRECTFTPQINQHKPIKLDHVAQYLHSDPFQRLSSTSKLKKSTDSTANDANTADDTGLSSPSKHCNSAMTRDFFDRLEMDMEIRKHRQRVRKKKSDPVFQPKINRKSQRLVNKNGKNFEDRQNQSLKNRSDIFRQHETKVMEGTEEKELKFQPELNSKSISLVENKKVPRNAPGYSRANYYVYAKTETPRNAVFLPTKSQNDKILQNNPKLQKYLAMDVTQRLLDQKAQKEILYGGNTKDAVAGGDGQDSGKENKTAVSNEKKMSEIELEDFIKRQKQYELIRRKRIAKLWKRFNNEESENDEDTDINVSSIIRDHQDILEEAGGDGIETKDEGLSYTQMFQSKQPTSTVKEGLSYSILSQKQMQCESQFVTV